MSAIFGAGWVFGKAAIDHFPPIMTAAFRFGFAGCLLMIFCKWPTVPKTQVLIISSCALALPYSLSYVGLAVLDVSTTVLLIQLEAPILIVMSALLLRERPPARALFGVALSMLGLLVVTGSPSVQTAGRAVALVLASIITWAFGQVVLRRLGSSDGGLPLLGAAALMAAPQLALLSAIFEEQHVVYIVTASMAAWLQVAYLAIFMTVVGQGIWFSLVGRNDLNVVAPFLLLVPVFSITGAVLFLGERPTLPDLIGGGLILAGVSLATLRPASAPP